MAFFKSWYLKQPCAGSQFDGLSLLFQRSHEVETLPWQFVMIAVYHQGLQQARVSHVEKKKRTEVLIPIPILKFWNTMFKISLSQQIEESEKEATELEKTVQ
jgi:hypothetical protein